MRFYLVTVGIRISLHAPRLISQDPKVNNYINIH
jgi:hypothetical protein